LNQAESNAVLLGKRIVVVEDEGITQLQLTRILRREGMDVVGAAADGQEAIAIVRATNPDLVLMDIRMPLMDGLEATEVILAEYPICIVVLTAFSDMEYVERARMIGAAGYVVKPITSDTLIPQLRAAYRTFISLQNKPPSA